MQTLRQYKRRPRQHEPKPLRVGAGLRMTKRVYAHTVWKRKLMPNKESNGNKQNESEKKRTASKQPYRKSMDKQHIKLSCENGFETKFCVHHQIPL